MDDTNDIRQQLTAEKNRLKQDILDSLKELYFLRNNGQMCDFQVWSSKDSFRSAVANIEDEDIKNDQKFTQLLNLKYEEPKSDLSVATPPVTLAPATTTITVTPPVTPKPTITVANSNSTTQTSTTTVTAKTEASITPNVNIASTTSTAATTTTTANALATETTATITTPSVTLTPSTITSVPSVTTALVTSTTTAISTSSSATTLTAVQSTQSSISKSTACLAEAKPIVPKSTATSPKIITITPSTTPPPSASTPCKAATNSTIAPTSPPKEESPTRISRAVEPIVNSSAVAAESIQRQNVEKAKHEHAVIARIAELRRQGLWSAQRLPKAQEPPRPKCHWDSLLEEARWLYNDYRLERKWKRDGSRRLAYSAYRFINSKRTQQERIEKEKLQHIRKVAATLSKEVRSFWSSIEKIVDFRQQTKLEETRKKAWDLHLNYILDQTSKFSNSCIGEPQVIAQAGQQLATNQPENNYLIKEEAISENTDKKESVINNDEQTRQYNQKVDDMAAGAESIQPKGNTFETTTVSTKVPFLLKHSLREYQHIGLDWLVAMYRKQLNGILADEMGLGKTIQTIALLAYLACEEQEWGPHLIVVPTSVMLNWEMELKKWCPAFKILTYYGTPKERKLKRVGWSRPNSFHICITSYRIVIQDHAAFRRKQWCYFILDEAHYIKNFKSQRWQMLLNFNSQRRLLLTGTPLQNDLMELWSLMHFLMPNLFDSLREFKDWFVNPLTGMIEGSHEFNQELVQRLHKVLRPFLLRRLKSDVEKQLPKKREVIKYCRLSKRQRYLYEEFMSHSKTKETLESGNYLSVINVLMQLRKVCNHPNLFEPRPTVSPFRMAGISYQVPSIVLTPLNYQPYRDVNLESVKLLLVDNGLSTSSIARDSVKRYKVAKARLVEELGSDKIEHSNSSSGDEDSVMEIDHATDAIESGLISSAYAALKKTQQANKRSSLDFLAGINDTRCGRIYSPYFSDLVDLLNLKSVDKLVKNGVVNSFSNGNGMLICSNLQSINSNPRASLDYMSSLILDAIKSPEQLVEQLASVIERYIFCVTGVNATPVTLNVSNSSKRKVDEVHLHRTLYSHLAPKFNILNKIMTNMQMTFPELRLIEYDCGKLQALGQLLIDLKSNDHRALIFTQMSRMLDILEQFLNYHGHTYLRLDGTTKIDQRQIMMERFNNDKRIFCFILSTRSGGIGVNLTGADTVIFYDSDWNPTMDAQAQDRCHRIGQTRDVTIYRLISEDTIEQNIYRKAQQKRMLGDLAIEDGNFGVSCFKKNAIQELFERNQAPLEVETVVEVENQSEEINKANLTKWEQAISKCEADAGEEIDVDAIKLARADVETDLREFDENVPLTEESSPVVEKSEKEQKIDSIVSQMTPVEQYAIKFLEVLHHDNFREELEQAEREYIQELENKKSQWEQSRVDMLREQAITNESKADCKTMLTYPRGAKCEHVQFMLDGSRKVEEMPLWAPPTPPTSPPSPVEDDNQFRYQPQMTPAMAARISAMGGLSDIFGTNADNKADNRYFIHEKDVYVDYTSNFFYEPDIMPESQLPPVHHSENEVTSYTIGSKKIRLTGTPVVPSGYLHIPSNGPHLQQHLQNLTNVNNSTDVGPSPLSGQQTNRKPKVRRDEVICLPRSLFDRPQGNTIKARRDLKLQKLRCVTKGNDSDPFAMQKFFHSFSHNSLGQSIPQETIVQHVQRQTAQYPNTILLYHQEQIPAWTIQEEWAVLMVLQHLQDLPVNLNILTPGHTPNWELVSEVVSDIGFTHRSFKMCEYHFAREVQKREMTRDSSWEERAMQASPASSIDGSQPPSKKMKKNKNQQASTDGPSSQASTTNSKSSTPAPSIPFKPSKTGGMLAHDRSLQLSLKERYTVVHEIRLSRPRINRARFASSYDRTLNTAPTLVRDDKRLIDYDRPQKPEIIIMELSEDRKRRALAARQQGHMMSLCSCCRQTPTAAPTPQQSTATPQPTAAPAVVPTTTSR